MKKAKKKFNDINKCLRLCCVLCCIVLYFTVLYCTVSDLIWFDFKYKTEFDAIIKGFRYSAVLCCILLQYIRYSAVQYSKIQHNLIWFDFRYEKEFDAIIKGFRFIYPVPKKKSKFVNPLTLPDEELGMPDRYIEIDPIFAFPWGDFFSLYCSLHFFFFLIVAQSLTPSSPFLGVLFFFSFWPLHGRRGD
jgi:hypothetical protein